MAYQASIPVSATCHGKVGDSQLSGGSGPGVPSVNLQVNISIPVKELLEALSLFTKSTEVSVEPGPVHEAASVAATVAVPARRGAGQAQVVPDVQLPNVPAPRSSRSSAPAVPEAPLALGVSGPWEVAGGSSGSATGSGSKCCTIEVSNLLKKMSSRHLKKAFSKHVGPVYQCIVDRGTSASLTFGSEDDARKAVEIFDGGILTIQEDQGDQEVCTLWPRSDVLKCLEDRLGQLSKCSLRGGEGWLTIFVSAFAQQLKSEKGQSTIGFKGTVLTLCLSDLSQIEQRNLSMDQVSQRVSFDL